MDKEEAEGIRIMATTQALMVVLITQKLKTLVATAPIPNSTTQTQPVVVVPTMYRKNSNLEGDPLPPKRKNESLLSLSLSL